MFIFAKDTNSYLESYKERTTSCDQLSVIMAIMTGKWHAQGEKNLSVNTRENAHISHSLFVPPCILSGPESISLYISVHATLQYLWTECQRSLLYKHSRNALSYQSTSTAHCSGGSKHAHPKSATWLWRQGTRWDWTHHMPCLFCLAENKAPLCHPEMWQRIASHEHPQQRWPL